MDKIDPPMNPVTTGTIMPSNLVSCSLIRLYEGSNTYKKTKNKENASMQSGMH